MKVFDSVVASAVRFGAGQHKLYKSEFRKRDVYCRRPSGHQEALTGPNRGTPFFFTGTTCRGTERSRILVKPYLNDRNLCGMSRSSRIGEG